MDYKFVAVDGRQFDLTERSDGKYVVFIEGVEHVLEPPASFYRLIPVGSPAMSLNGAVQSK